MTLSPMSASAFWSPALSVTSPSLMKKKSCYIVCLRSGVDLFRHPGGPRLLLNQTSQSGSVPGRPRTPLGSHLGGEHLPRTRDLGAGA